MNRCTKVGTSSINRGALHKGRSAQLRSSLRCNEHPSAPRECTLLDDRFFQHSRSSAAAHIERQKYPEVRGSCRSPHFCEPAGDSSAHAVVTPQRAKHPKALQYVLVRHLLVEEVNCRRAEWVLVARRSRSHHPSHQKAAASAGAPVCWAQPRPPLFRCLRWTTRLPLELLSTAQQQAPPPSPPPPPPQNQASSPPALHSMPRSDQQQLLGRRSIITQGRGTLPPLRGHTDSPAAPTEAAASWTSRSERQL